MGIPMRAVNTETPAGGGLSERACRILAGADAGIAGGALVLAWLVFASRLQGGYWWTNWNVAGAVFYGERVYGMGWGAASITGAAVLLLLYALLGALFAILARPRGFAFNLLAGVTVALLWHQAAAWIFWPRWGPGVIFYLHPAVMLPANLLFGISLIRFGPRFRKVATALGGEEWAAEYRPVRLPPLPPPPPLPREFGAAEPPQSEAARSEPAPPVDTAGPGPEPAPEVDGEAPSGEESKTDRPADC